MTAPAPQREAPQRQPQPDDLLTLEDVRARTQLGTSTLYRYVKAKTFPAPLHLSGRAVRWIRREVDEWQSTVAGRRM